MLSRDKVPRQNLDFNLGDVEINGDVLGEVLDLTVRIYLKFLCCRGDIVKILFSRWRHPYRCSNRFLEWTPLEV